MKWHPFTHSGTTYDLAHLHDLEFDLVQPAHKEKPERIYPITVEFSLHCFAKTSKASDDPTLAYSDSRETRTFCFVRYALSQQLPTIMRSLDSRICHHTVHGNFVTIDLVLQSGEHVEYEVYFAPSKTTANGKKRIKLYVQSAYVRDEESADYRPRPVKSRKIKIHTIAHNTLHNRPIKSLKAPPVRMRLLGKSGLLNISRPGWRPLARRQELTPESVPFDVHAQFVPFAFAKCKRQV